MEPDPLIGRVLGRYEILSRLGAGGMGVVNRAHDRVLLRDVALKFLGEAFALKPEISLREARAASALSHPNICTVYEVAETQGESFIVMELIEGKSLSELIGGVGLPFQSVLRYGAQIAAALAHAHGRNI